MSDFEINDHKLQAECQSIADKIWTEMLASLPADETPEDKRDEMSDRAHESVDGHEWVIYNHKALMICAYCTTDQGEDFLEETGMPSEPDIYKLACTIAFGEMRARVEECLSDLADAWEDTREVAEE